MTAADTETSLELLVGDMPDIACEHSQHATRPHEHSDEPAIHYVRFDHKDCGSGYDGPRPGEEVMFRRYRLTTLCPGLPYAAFDAEFFATRRGAVGYVRRSRVLHGRLFTFRLTNERTGEEENL